MKLKRKVKLIREESDQLSWGELSQKLTAQHRLSTEGLEKIYNRYELAKKSRIERINTLESSSNLTREQVREAIADLNGEISAISNLQTYVTEWQDLLEKYKALNKDVTTLNTIMHEEFSQWDASAILRAFAADLTDIMNKLLKISPDTRHGL